jgi:hypothetical protein
MSKQILLRDTGIDKHGVVERKKGKYFFGALILLKNYHHTQDIFIKMNIFCRNFLRLFFWRKFSPLKSNVTNNKIIIPALWVLRQLCVKEKSSINSNSNQFLSIVASFYSII